MIYNLVDAVQFSGAVKRFHAKITLQQNTVGEHTYGVLWWLRIITPPDELDKNLLLHALQHDFPEFRTGDVPAPTKLQVAKESDMFSRMDAAVYDEFCLELPELTDAQSRYLKIADYLDGLAFCCREEQLGNTTLTATREAYSGMITKLLPTLPQAELAHCVFVALTKRVGGAYATLSTNLPKAPSL